MSNFLQVPRQRRDSYKSGVWDFLESEQLKKNGEEGEEVQISVPQTNNHDGNGESGDEKVEGQAGTSLNKDDFYTSLITKAPYIPGDAGELVTFDEIPWADKSLVQESVTFHKKHFAHEIFSITAAIIFGFALKPTSAVLLRTKSDRLTNPEESFERHISTIERITKFFDFHKNPDDAYDEILKIRKMHAEASRSTRTEQSPGEDLKLEEPWKKAMVEAIQMDLEFIDTSEAPQDNILAWDSPVPMSQFDMVANQLGFWVHLWLFPKFFGIKNRVQEMRGVIHVWAIFGRLLGIKDEFNICLLNPDEVATADLYEKLYRNVMLQSLKTIDETVVTIQNTFMTAFTQRVPFATYKAVMYFGLQNVEGYKGNNLWKLMTWKDKISVRFLQALFLLMRYSRQFRMAVNYLLYFWFQLQVLLYLPSKKWRIPIPRYMKNAITLKLY